MSVREIVVRHYQKPEEPIVIDFLDVDELAKDGEITKDGDVIMLYADFIVDSGISIDDVPYVYIRDKNSISDIKELSVVRGSKISRITDIDKTKFVLDLDSEELIYDGDVVVSIGNYEIYTSNLHGKYFYMIRRYGIIIPSINLGKTAYHSDDELVLTFRNMTHYGLSISRERFTEKQFITLCRFLHFYDGYLHAPADTSHRRQLIKINDETINGKEFYEEIIKPFQEGVFDK